MEINFRFADISDLPQIVAIYNSTIPSRLATADTEFVSVESKKIWFYEHNSNCPLWVVKNDENTITGWLSFQAFYGRPAYSKTVEVSIYIHEDYRGKGLGTKILEFAIHSSKSIGLKTLLGYIFSHNAPSIKLFERHGFILYGQFPEIAEMDNQLYSLSIYGLKI
jgi:phosphinothricin acetyltransferase